MSKSKWITLFILPLMVVAQLAMPVTAFADDGTPPPSEPAASETTPAEESAPVESAPALAESDLPVEEPAAIDGGASAPLAESIAQLPEGTEVVVTDASGEALPLASAEAAQVAATHDPMWCPAGDDPGSSGCSKSYNSLEDLVNDFSDGLIIQFGTLSTMFSPTGAGVIWIEEGTDASAASITIDGSAAGFSNIMGSDLTLQGGWSGAITGPTVTDITGKTTFDNSIKIINWNGAVTLNDIIVDGTAGDGIYISAADGITLNNVSSNNNEISGAYLESEGNISVTNSEFNGNGNTSGSEGRGLVAHSLSDITLVDVIAIGNGSGGAELINCFFIFSGSGGCQNTNPGKISITGTNVFMYNGYNPVDIGAYFGGGGSGLYASVGLWVGSNNGATLEGVTVQNNGAGMIAGGALIFTQDGSLDITDSDFSNNCMDCGFGFGFITLNLLGDTTLNRVVANGTGNDAVSTPSDGAGGLIIAGGDVFVKDSTFNENCTIDDCSGLGLGIFTPNSGNIILDHVTADNNGTLIGGGTGISISGGGAVNVICGSFENNLGYGLQGSSSGTLTLTGVKLSGNTDGPLDYKGIVVENPSGCGSSSGEKRMLLPGLPLNIVTAISSQTADLDCENFSGTKLILENGSSVTLPCPLGDSASVTGNVKDKLPGALPDGLTFQSSFTSAVTKNGAGLSDLTNPAIIEFTIPAGMDASNLSILFWDGSKWIEMDNVFVAVDGHLAVPVNFTGTFVLASK